MARDSVPTQGTMNFMNRVHRAIIWVTRGKLGWSVLWMPVLELTTIGRKSGEPRSSMLSSPVQPGASYVVVASRGGDDKHPAWYLNLVANPQVQVSYQGRPAEPRIARVATVAERAALWPRITAQYTNYGEYQKKTSREIPLVFLDPAS